MSSFSSSTGSFSPYLASEGYASRSELLSSSLRADSVSTISLLSVSSEDVGIS